MINGVKAIDIHKLSDAEREEVLRVAANIPLPKDLSEESTSYESLQSSAASAPSPSRTPRTQHSSAPSPVSSIATPEEVTKQPVQQAQRPNIALSPEPRTLIETRAQASPVLPAMPSNSTSLALNTSISSAHPEPSTQTTTAAAVGLDSVASQSVIDHGAQLTPIAPQHVSHTATSFPQTSTGTSHSSTQVLDADMVDVSSTMQTISNPAQPRKEHAGTDMEGVIETTEHVDHVPMNSSGPHGNLAAGATFSSTVLPNSSANASVTVEPRATTDVIMGDAEENSQPIADTSGMNSGSIATAFHPSPAHTAGALLPALQQDAAAGPTSQSTVTTSVGVSGGAQSQRYIDPEVVNRSNLVKRKRKSEPCDMSPGMKQHDTEEPDCFFMLGPAFREKLHEELVGFVEKFDNLVALQPWFATFRLSMKSIRDWESLLAQEIELQHLQGFTNGADSAFREAYAKFAHLYELCETIPLTWYFRHWLQDFALPLIIKDSIQKMQVYPSGDNAGPGQSQRRVGLEKIFGAMAHAYLRMVLVKAQGSSTEIELSKYGSKYLPDGVPAGWKQIQDLAVGIEYTKASRSASGDKSYEELINAAENSFEEDHESAWRNIIKSKAASAGKKADARNSFASKDDYLKEMHDQQRLPQDDGITQLIFELKRVDLQADLNNIVPAPLQKNVLPPGNRKAIIRELAVQMLVAHDDWRSIHPGSEVLHFADPYQAIKLIAIKKEAQMAAQVEAYSLPAREDYGRHYRNKARELRGDFIDDPLETLKMVVKEFDGSTHAGLVDMDHYSAQLREEIHKVEESLPREAVEEEDEPVARRRRYYDTSGVRQQLGDANWKLAGGENGPLAWDEDEALFKDQ
jgi:hypothetical protein